MRNKETGQEITGRWHKNPYGDDEVCPHGYDDTGSYCDVCDKAFVDWLMRVT